MNHSRDNAGPAFTLIEVIVIVATLALLFAVLLPALAKQKGKKERIDCVNNLKQIGLSFRIWAGDGGDRYPMAMPTNQGGTMEYVLTGEVFRHFQAMSNELGSTRILICPADKTRAPAPDFTRLANTNLSYFVVPDANENLPQSILSGDRNITNRFSPTNGMLVLMTNQLVGWTKEMHKFQGNVALGDGSVQQSSSALLRSGILPNTGFATNRILLP